jgi:hypothetical protein
MRLRKAANPTPGPARETLKSDRCSGQNQFGSVGEPRQRSLGRAESTLGVVCFPGIIGISVSFKEIPPIVQMGVRADSEGTFALGRPTLIPGWIQRKENCVALAKGLSEHDLVVQRTIIWHYGAVQTHVNYKCAPPDLRPRRQLAQSTRQGAVQKRCDVPRRQVGYDEVGRECLAAFGLHGDRTAVLANDPPYLLAVMHFATVPFHRLRQSLAYRTHSASKMDDAASGQI